MLDHRAENGAGEAEGPFEIGLEHNIPILTRHPHRERVARDASIVHKDIAAAEVRENLLAHLLHRIKIGYVHRIRPRRIRRNGVDSLGRADGVRLRAAHHSDLSPLTRKMPRNAFADSPARSRNNRHLIFKSFCAHAGFKLDTSAWPMEIKKLHAQ